MHSGTENSGYVEKHTSYRNLYWLGKMQFSPEAQSQKSCFNSGGFHVFMTFYEEVAVEIFTNYFSFHGL